LTASITLNQIKYVLALEKEGSFSQAAKKCFVTQSTLSTMIRKLEDHLNLLLFDRKSKPIKLTEEGEKLINQLRQINYEYENLLELIQETTEEFHGTFSIGIIPTLAPFLLPLFLNELVANNPKVNFRINEITTVEIVDRVKKRELDIGILSLPIQEKELVQKTLFHEDFLIYDANQPLLSKKKKRFKIKDIDINRLWLLEESHCLSNQVENICQLRQKRKLSNNLTYNSGSILSLLELVNINSGITILPRLAALNENLINDDFIYKLEEPVPVREVGIISHQNFSKKRLLSVIDNQICESVKPFLKTTKKYRVIKPY